MRPRAPTTTADAMKLWTPAIDPRDTLAKSIPQQRSGARSPRGFSGSKSSAGTPALNALLVLFRSIATGEPQAVLRIVLDRDAPPDQAPHVHRPRWRRCGDAGRLRGGHHRLARRRGRRDLHGGPAIRPTTAWALGSTVAIAKFTPLAGVECLTILVRNDGGKSERACTACAGLWRAAGRQVIRNIPRPDCKDLNDVLMSERA